MNPLVLAGDEIPVMIALLGGLTVAVLSIILTFTRSILAQRAREQTKREIAAYIAEGTMTPEDGERIIKADLPAWHKGEFSWNNTNKS